MVADGHLDSAALFRSHARFVAGFLLRMGVPRSELDDLVQEVFLVVHKIGGYSPGPAKPATFLASIAFRACVTQRRKQRTRGFVRADDDTVNVAPDDQRNPEQERHHKDRLELLQHALDAMDADKRVVFVMAELYDESVVSIAAGLGIPVDTAYSRLRAARLQFRGAVESLSAETSVSPPAARGVNL